MPDGRIRNPVRSSIIGPEWAAVKRGREELSL